MTYNSSGIDDIQRCALMIYTTLRTVMIYQVCDLDKKQPKLSHTVQFRLFFGAGSRGRTDTVLLPSDFESDASANSTIPAYGVGLRQC